MEIEPRESPLAGSISENGRNTDLQALKVLKGFKKTKEAHTKRMRWLANAYKTDRKNEIYPKNQNSKKIPIKILSQSLCKSITIEIKT